MHDDRDRLTGADEAVMLTADEVPVELVAELQYRIRDLRAFLFAGSRQPDDLLRATAESVLREVAAGASLDTLLTDRRAEFERRSLSMLRVRSEKYALGIEVVDLQWLDVHPPQPVVPAYRLVADALEERELLINEAEAYASRTLLSAVGEQGLRCCKKAARKQTPDIRNSPTRTDWQLDDELWKELREQDAAGEMKLSGAAAAIIDEGRTASIQREMSSTGSARRFESLYAEYASQSRLTSRHLYWTTMADVLAQRPLTIIDPKAVGRQQFWLGEPIPGLMLPMQRSDRE